MSDYYQILGIDRQASIQQVKSAFKKLALLYHPDRNPDNPAAEEKFKQINEAYQVLSDEDDKRLYDLRLDGQYSQSPSYKTYQQTEPRYTYSKPQSHTHTYAPRYTYTPAQSRKAYLAGTLILIIIAVCGYSFYNFMNHTMAKSHYAEALEQIENNDLYSAFMQLEEALHFDNEYAEAYLKRGQLHLSVGKGYLYAYSDFNHAIRYAKSPVPEMYFFRGLCLYRMGEYAKVIQDCKQAIQQQALRGPAIFLQAAAKKALQDNTGACQDWQQAYTLGIISSADSIGVYCQ